MHNFLEDPLISAEMVDGISRKLSLPELLFAFSTDSVRSIQALRPHQRHPFHAFMSQLGAMASYRAGSLPTTSDEWLKALRHLTKDHANDSPWHLISNDDQPAILQPVTPMSTLKPVGEAADEIDLVITSRVHEIKPARMNYASPEHWLFSLISTQTFNGYFGAGNFGIARMNGGHGTRCGVGIKPSGGLGAHIMRDMDLLLELREGIKSKMQYAENGIELVWLSPWDGAEEISMRDLDPYFIEVCRRIRIVESNGNISALGGTSKSSRIVKPPAGVTGDPWMPLVQEKDGVKALSVDARGFSYQALSRILFGDSIRPADAMLIRPKDGKSGLSIVCRAFVRKEGGTEGYHERSILISPKAAGLLSKHSDQIGKISHEMVADLSTIANSVLKPALMALLQNGPEKIDYEDKSANARADAILSEFKEVVDVDFFDDLWDIAERSDVSAETGLAARAEWQEKSLARALGVLNSAETKRTGSSRLRHRAISAANGMFQGSIRKKFPHLFAVAAETTLEETA